MTVNDLVGLGKKKIAKKAKKYITDYESHKDYPLDMLFLFSETEEGFAYWWNIYRGDFKKAKKILKGI